MNKIPGFVESVLKTLETGGHEAFLVGGCLRDMLLQREIHDWDVATSARSGETAELFDKTVNTGVRFGTVTVITDGGPVEVTTFRTDGAYSDGRRPDQVHFVDDLLEDLKRRDFTVNAMAMSRDGRLRDPFNGRGDLQRRLIRCVGDPRDRFSEDALRLFRALRFSAQLGFDIEEDTMAAMGACAPLCASLSAERVRDETEKILMSERPALVFRAIELGLFTGRISSLPMTLGLPAAFPPGAFGDIDITPGFWDVRMRWAAFTAVLVHRRLIDSAAPFFKAMRLDTKTVKSAGAGVAMALQEPLPQDKAGIKHVLAAVGVDAARCAAAADEMLRGGNAVRRVNDVISGGECYSFDALAVSGDDLMTLGLAQGVGLGTALKSLLDHVIEHPEDNKREVLLKLAEKQEY